MTTEELDTVAAWARWLESVQPDAFHRKTYERVQGTLTALKKRAKET